MPGVPQIDDAACCFVTIPEASALVLEAAAMGQGGGRDLLPEACLDGAGRLREGGGG